MLGVFHIKDALTLVLVACRSSSTSYLIANTDSDGFTTFGLSFVGHGNIKGINKAIGAPWVATGLWLNWWQNMCTDLITTPQR